MEPAWPDNLGLEMTLSIQSLSPYISVVGGLLGLLVTLSVCLVAADKLLGRRIDRQQVVVISGQKELSEKIDDAVRDFHDDRAQGRKIHEDHDRRLTEHGERLAWTEGRLGKPLGSMEREAHEPPPH